MSFALGVDGDTIRTWVNRQALLPWESERADGSAIAGSEGTASIEDVGPSGYRMHGPAQIWIELARDPATSKLSALERANLEALLLLYNYELL